MKRKKERRGIGKMEEEENLRKEGRKKKMKGNGEKRRNKKIHREEKR